MIKRDCFICCLQNKRRIYMEELKSKIMEGINKRLESEHDLLSRLDMIILKIKLEIDSKQ